MDSLVTTAWLADTLDAPDLRVIDASYYLPEHKRDARAEYAADHIPGALFLDLATFADPGSGLPSMAPPRELAEERLGSLGIGNATRVVVYDDSPLHSAARGWWLLRLFGVAEVAILDGGLAKWRTEDRPTAHGIDTAEPAAFAAASSPERVRDIAAMTANLTRGAEQVIDARSPARFEGREPETRPNTEAGHIPGSRNLPYASLFNPDGTWKRGAALAQAFADRGIDLDRPMIATCGSGITAAALVFGAHLLGHDAALYDGSWAEWGATPSAPKATGPA
ncbi:MAG TPA: sulfurtransferase [Sphingomonas sp.]|nr:sulfurtransferase [Sphingomonas sp.]